MILFFNNKSGKIYGFVGGRIHIKEELNSSVQPQGVPQEEISKKIFSIEETKKIEKSNFKILNKKVLLKNNKFNGFTDDDKIKTSKPDAIETILIDLTKPLKEIKAEFSETTRRWIKKAINMTFREIGFNERNIVFNVLEELEDLKDISLAKQILQVRAPFLDGLRRMYVVENMQKIPLAVALITCFKNNKFIYTLGGVTKNGRNTHAGDYLIFSLIKDAKELGYKIFDLGGIYADWADDKKKQVNNFKQRWGGKKNNIYIA